MKISKLHNLKLVSIGIAVSITISSIGSSVIYADDESFDNNISVNEELKAVVPSNDMDDQFPLHGEVLFYEDTVSFVETNCSECDYAVDKEELDSSVIFTAKQSGHTFQLEVLDDNQTPISVMDSSNESSEIIFPEYDKYYSFSLVIDGNRYFGDIGLIFEGCNVVYLDIGYLTDETYSLNNSSRTSTYSISQNTSYIYESESNDTKNTAQTINIGRTVSGYSDKAYDSDWYYINLQTSEFNNSTFTNGFFNIVLNTYNNPSIEFEIKLYAENSDSNLVLLGSGTVSSQRCQYINQTNPNGYRKFYIYIHNITNNSTRCQYMMNANYSPSLTFYSQKRGSVTRSNGSSTCLWNTQYLDVLTFANGKPFIDVNSSDIGCMSSGCAIASYAMILRNVGAKMDGKDFRTGFVGRLYADPFTVMLASNNLDGTTLTTASANYLAIANPTYANRDLIAANFTAFGKTIYSHRLYLQGTSTAYKMNALDSILDQNGKYRAVIYTENGTTPHYTVVSSYNSSYSDPLDRYTVYDPSGTTLSHAKGLKFRYSNIHEKANTEFSDVQSIVYFNTNQYDFTI